MKFRSLAVLFCLASLLSLGRSASASAATREAAPWNDDWQFLRADAPLTADPAGWSAVTLPHTWNAQDASHGGGTKHDSRDGYYRGPGWYVKAFEASPEWRGRRVFVRFEAVSLVADVYLNGHHLGQHRGAFTAFCYELTPFLKPGRNELRVRADNTWRPDVPPLSGDFPVFGGIYRPVTLIVTAPTCISLRDYGSPGVYVATQKLTATDATIGIRTEIDPAAAVSACVECTIRAGTQSIATGRSALVALTPGAAQEIAQTITLPNPHRWQGRADPFLYTVEVRLLVEGQVCDRVVQTFGVRELRFDPQRGCYLNGQPYRLWGVNFHQDRAGKGWAVSGADLDEDLALVHELGARAVRTAHYPQAQRVYDLCDRYGILAWVELPLVDCITDSPEFTANARQQLTEMIRQHYNHPSVFAWSLFNELYNAPTPDPTALLRELQTLAKQEDPARPTTAATCRAIPALCRITDLIAFNAYPGWYHDSASMMKNAIAQYDAAAGHRGIAVSEYGAGASIRQHEDTPHAPKPGGPWHPEEWQALVHEQDYAAIAATPSCWGSFLWNMFDFASVWRHEGDAPGINDKGLVTYDRKTRKDAFYFYQANWSDEPVVYLTDRRFTARQRRQGELKVYSNADSVELFVNGTSLGVAAPAQGVCRWPDVAFRPGKNEVEARGTFAHRTPVADHIEFTVAE